MPSSAFFILKYVASIITAVYGFYATLTDFHEEREGRDGKKIKVLSKKGYRGLALLAVSSVLALSTDFAKDYREVKDKLETDKRDAQSRKQVSDQLSVQLNTTQEITKSLDDQGNKLRDTLSNLERNSRTTRRILDETGRVLEPIKTLNFSFKLRLPSDSPEMQEYISRLDREIADHIKPGHSDLGTLHAWISGGGSQGSGTPESIETIVIEPGSPLLPERSRDTIPYYVVRYGEFLVGFYKTSNPRDSNGLFRPPDLDITLESGLYPDEKSAVRRVQASHSLEYDLTKHRLSILCSSISPTPSSWGSTGKITSIPDLKKSYVLIRLVDGSFSSNPDITRALLKIKRAESLSELSISTWDGQIFYMDTHKLTRVHQALDVSRAYTGQFTHLFQRTPPLPEGAILMGQPVR